MLTYQSFMVLSPKTLTYPLATPLEKQDLNAYEPCLFLLGLESCVDMSFEKYEASESNYLWWLDRDLIDHNEAAALLAGVIPCLMRFSWKQYRAESLLETKPDLNIRVGLLRWGRPNRWALQLLFLLRRHGKSCANLSRPSAVNLSSPVPTILPQRLFTKQSG